MLGCLKGGGDKRARKTVEWDGGQDFDTDHYVRQKLHCVLFNDRARAGIAALSRMCECVWEL